jgi:hypothetical protein
MFRSVSFIRAGVFRLAALVVAFQMGPSALLASPRFPALIRFPVSPDPPSTV